MHFTTSLLVLTSISALGALAKVDVGGPHGNYQPARRHIAPQLMNDVPSGFQRRHRKRSTKCASKSNASAGSQSDDSSSDASSEEKDYSGYGSPEAAYTATSSASASASAAGAAQSTAVAVADQNIQVGHSSSADAEDAAATSSSTGSSSDSSSSSSSSSSSDSSSGNIVSDALSAISSFLASPNTGIGSWFRTNNGNDDTNGRSWCQLSYQDDWMGFAPSVDTMLSNFGNDLETAATHYCGLEAKAVNPDNGNEALIYIVDGFASEWVKTPESVDLTLGAFKALYGEEADDKNTVISNLQWTLTGNRKEEYSYNYGN